MPAVIEAEFLSEVKLGSYDPQTKLLTFAALQAPMSLVQPQATFSWDLDHDPNSCSVSPSSRAMQRISNPLLHQHRLSIAVGGGERITPPQVPPSIAKLMIRNAYTRLPYVSAIVVLNVNMMISR